MKSPTGNPDVELTEVETMAAKLEARRNHNDFMARMVMVMDANKERDVLRLQVHCHQKAKLEWEEEVTEWRKKFDECYTMYKMMESLWKDELDKGVGLLRLLAAARGPNRSCCVGRELAKCRISF